MVHFPGSNNSPRGDKKSSIFNNWGPDLISCPCICFEEECLRKMPFDALFHSSDSLDFEINCNINP